MCINILCMHTADRQQRWLTVVPFSLVGQFVPSLACLELSNLFTRAERKPAPRFQAQRPRTWPALESFRIWIASLWQHRCVLDCLSVCHSVVFRSIGLLRIACYVCGWFDSLVFAFFRCNLIYVLVSNYLFSISSRNKHCLYKVLISNSFFTRVCRCTCFPK